jgi:putative methyltransferase (TIGR04325 family)
MNRIKKIVKEWIPPIMLGFARKKLLQKDCRKEKIYLDGDYKSWGEAASDCTGYANTLILEKVLESTLKVIKGEAVYERDSVIFDKIEYSWPVTAALMWAMAKNNGSISVIDYGGSLGSSYFQNRKFLTHGKNVHWSIVEQLSYVKIGRSTISNEIVQFYETIEECCKEKRPNVALISSVLQYIENQIGRAHV